MVTTESDLAVCRARVICGAAVVPPPPPLACTAPTWTGTLQIPPFQGVTDGKGLAVACDGSTYATAFSADFANLGQPLHALFRFDAAGALAATVRTADLLAGLTLDREDGDFVVVVGSGAARQDVLRSDTPVLVRRYDPSFTLRWEHAVDGLAPGAGGLASPVAAAVDASSDTFIAAALAPAGQPPQVHLSKLSPAGAVVSDQIVVAGSLGGLAVAADGHAYVAGSTGAALPGEANAGGLDAFVVALDPSGQPLWGRELGGPGDEAVNGVAVGPQGQVAIAGVTMAALDGGAPLDGPHAFVAVWDAAGTLAWVRVLRPTNAPGIPVPATSSAGRVAFDATGALWVLGDVAFGTLDPAQPAVLTSEPFVTRLESRRDAPVGASDPGG